MEKGLSISNDRILLEQCRLLFTFSYRIAIASVVLSLVIGGMVWQTSEHWKVVGFIVANILVTGIRVALIHAFRRQDSPEKQDGAMPWLARYAGLAFFSGIIWGVVPVLFYVEGSIDGIISQETSIGNQYLLSMSIFLVAVLALLSYGPHLWTYYSYFTPVMMGVVAGITVLGSNEALWGTLIVGVGGATTVIFALRYNRYIIGSICQQYENMMLAASNHAAREEAENQRHIAEQSVARQQAIIDAVPVPVFVQDAKGFFSVCNTAFEKLIGFPRIRILGFPVTDLTSGSWAEGFRREDARIVEQNTASMVEEVITNASGHDREVVIRRAALHESGDDVSGLVGAIFDVTEEKRATDELLTTYRRFREYLDLSPVGAAITRRKDGLLVYVNPAFIEMAGSSEAELVGNPIVDFLYNMEERDRLKAMLARGERIHQLETRAQRVDGTEFWGVVTVGNTMFEGEQALIWWLYDITRRKQEEQALSHMALHDHLTGLANRSLFLEQLDKAVARARRGQTDISVMYFDLDGFKKVNDDMGHGFGDYLLKEVAQRLRDVTRSDDVIARLGGDEFAMLVEGDRNPARLATIAEKVISTVAQPVSDGEHYGQVTVSIGIACWPEDGKEPDILVRSADVAMYRAKEAGKNAFAFADQSDFDDA